MDAGRVRGLAEPLVRNPASLAACRWAACLCAAGVTLLDGYLAFAGKDSHQKRPGSPGRGVSDQLREAHRMDYDVCGIITFHAHACHVDSLPSALYFRVT
jgi:hypothetical protein